MSCCRRLRGRFLARLARTRLPLLALYVLPFSVLDVVAAAAPVVQRKLVVFVVLDAASPDSLLAAISCGCVEVGEGANQSRIEVFADVF